MRCATQLSRTPARGRVGDAFRSVPGTSTGLVDRFHGTTAAQLERSTGCMERLLREQCHVAQTSRTGAPGTMTTMLGNARCPGACTLILVVLTSRASGLCRQGFSDISQKLRGRLVKADHRPFGITGFDVEVQHVLHGRHKLTAHLRDAPLLFPPRLERVFFSRSRTVSWDRDGASPSSTALPASRRSVQ